jgi:hypothetical protein
MTEYLSPQELHQLTDYARPSGQVEWLRANGIPYKEEVKRGVIRLIVSREHVRSWIEGKPVLARGGLKIEAIR